MAVHGVYKVTLARFDSTSDMELHIKELDSGLLASLKGQNFNRTFFNGQTIMSPHETESHNFIFHSAQVDEYIGLVPPGGYHVGGVELGGTVSGDTLVGTIKFKNGLIFSVQGHRIKGKPSVNSKIRTDGIIGINRQCVCKNTTCTHHGFCDSCHIFDSSGGIVTTCMAAQYEKKYPGRIKEFNLLFTE